MENKETFTIIITVLAVIIAFSLLYQPIMGYGMMPFFYPGFGFAFVFMLLIWILIITTLVLFILWLIKQLRKGGRK